MTETTRSARTVSDWQYGDRLATALDEVAILDQMGDGGWELTHFGPFVLHFRRPEDPEARSRWEYLRLIELLGNQSERVERDGWIYTGSWGLINYYKRVVAATRTEASPRRDAAAARP